MLSILAIHVQNDYEEHFEHDAKKLHIQRARAAALQNHDLFSRRLIFEELNGSV